MTIALTIAVRFRSPGGNSPTSRAGEEDEDPIAVRKQLIELAAGHEHRDALGGDPPQLAEELGLGADVDPAGRLVEEQEHDCPPIHLPRTTRCWLPPERAPARIRGLETLIASALISRLANASRPGGDCEPESRQARQRGQARLSVTEALTMRPWSRRSSGTRPTPTRIARPDAVGGTAHRRASRQPPPCPPRKARAGTSSDPSQRVRRSRPSHRARRACPRSRRRSGR